jgi:hypothetical protein
MINTGIISYALAEHVVLRRSLSSMIYGEPQGRNLTVRITCLEYTKSPLANQLVEAVTPNEHSQIMGQWDPTTYQ